VRRGWFDLSFAARGVVASEPVRTVTLHNRLAWGAVDVAGGRLYLDSGRRAQQVAELNAVVEHVLRGEFRDLPTPAPAATRDPRI
jgi:hypothetical protein